MMTRLANNAPSLPVITKVEFFIGQMPTRTRFSFGRKAFFDFSLVRISAGKTSGTGEALSSPSPALNRLGKSLLGQDPAVLDGLVSDLSGEPPGYREMLSIALHDLVGRLTNTPMHKLLGCSATRHIQLMPCLFPDDPEHARQTADSWVQQGFKSLKLKLFGDLKSDLQLIRAVRSVFTSGFLQGDLNCALASSEQVVKILPQLADAGLDALEDPMTGPLEEYLRLMEVSQRPKIILDAPSRGWPAIREIARLRCCDAVNLHPNQQGSMAELRERHKILLNANLEAEIGGTGFTGVGSWAYAHVAQTVKGNYPLGELGGVRDHGMPASTARDGIPILNGAAPPIDRPGHGGELNEQVARRYCTEVIVLP